MGGAAFAQASAAGEPTLSTPRMSPAVYQHLKSNYLAKLQQYFPNGKVVSLIEAPEKLDYGDIDFVVAIDQQVDQVALAKYLGAAGFISRSTGGHQALTVAVARDGLPSATPVVIYHHVDSNALGKTRKAAETMSEQEYAQIDIEIIEPGLLEWHIFYSSYSDMAGLLGHIVTNLGFTISDVGLWLRLKELDDSKEVVNSGVADKDGYILLTRDPKLVMRFLDLSVEGFEAGFTTLEGLYSWLFKCRLLCAESLKIKRDNSHERRREATRKIYSQFFFEWLPEHMNMDIEMNEQDQRNTVQVLRQKFRDEAVTFFSKQDEFQNMQTTLVRKLRNAVAVNLLKPIIAEHSGLEGKKLTEVVRAFRRHVGFDTQNQPHVLQDPHTDAEAQLFRFLDTNGEALKDPAAASSFVEAHWEDLKALLRHSSGKS